MLERRKTQRVHVELKVRARTADEETFTRTANLSLDGIFMTEVLPFDAGTEVEVAFLLPDDGALIQSQAVVVHSQDSGLEMPPDSTTGNGLRFADMDAKSREDLALFLGEEP
jgi:uncharacterized protein (TIGR02266 family)